eukprot:141124-Chlamydomonas_euryale.AAC.1
MAPFSAADAPGTSAAARGEAAAASSLMAAGGAASARLCPAAPGVSACSGTEAPFGAMDGDATSASLLVSMGSSMPCAPAASAAASDCTCTI